MSDGTRDPRVGDVWERDGELREVTYITASDVYWRHPGETREKRTRTRWLYWRAWAYKARLVTEGERR